MKSYCEPHDEDDAISWLHWDDREWIDEVWNRFLRLYEVREGVDLAKSGAHAGTGRGQQPRPGDRQMVEDRLGNHVGLRRAVLPKPL